MLKAKFEGITSALGADPQDPSTTYGPLVDKGQYDKVRSMIQAGSEKAELISGGKDADTKGYYIGPVIFKDPTKDSEIYKEEVFGPVLCVKTFKTEEEVLEMANDSQYGLAGTLNS